MHWTSFLAWLSVMVSSLGERTLSMGKTSSRDNRVMWGREAAEQDRVSEIFYAYKSEINKPLAWTNLLDRAYRLHVERCVRGCWAASAGHPTSAVGLGRVKTPARHDGVELRSHWEPFGRLAQDFGHVGR